MHKISPRSKQATNKLEKRRREIKEKRKGPGGVNTALIDKCVRKSQGYSLQRNGGFQQDGEEVDH